MNRIFVTVVLVMLFHGAFPSCMERDDIKTIRCKRKHVIFEPKVEQSHVNCTERRPCTGLSPLALVERNECYWKENCKITQREMTVMVYKLNGNQCVGQMVAATAVDNFYCVKGKSLYTFIPKTPDVNDPKKVKIKSKAGLIRSHHIYPWHYTHRVDTEDRSIEIKIRNGQIMWLTIYDLQVDVNNDNLTLEHGGQTEKLTSISGTGNRNYTNSGGQDQDVVKITFHTKPTSNFGRGFVICFQRMKRKQFRRIKTKKGETACSRGRKKNVLKKMNL